MKWVHKLWDRLKQFQPLLSVLAVILAGSSLWVTYSIYQNQITHFAWGRLSTHMPGNSGIGGALNFLYDKDEDIRFIDLRPFGQAYAADGETESQENLARVVSVNMSEADLTGSWLDNTHFSESDFAKAILKNVHAHKAVFENVDFTNAVLTEGDFDSAKFRSVDFTGATLEKGVFSGAVLDSATLAKANASEVNLQGATAWGVVFDDAIMMWANLTKILGQSSSFKSADLSNAYLIDGEFSYSLFSYADLSDAYLYGANFAGANLSGVRFVGAKGLETAKLGDSWVWENDLPVFSTDTMEAIEKYGIVVYKDSCKEMWQEQVKEKLDVRSDEQVDLVDVYRPPSNADCLVKE